MRVVMSFPVTVVIPTWNSTRTLGKCLQSIRKYLDPKEIVIVDGNSTDETVRIAEKYGCTILYDTTSLGSARMTGVRRASTDLIVFIDDDIEIDESFARVFDFFDERTGAVQCLALPLGSRVEDSNAIRSVGNLKKLSLDDRGYTNGTAIRRNLIFDLDISRLNAYEDWAISRYIIKKGYDWKVIPIPVWHDHGSSDPFLKSAWNTYGLFNLARCGFINVREFIRHYLSRLLGAFKNMVNASGFLDVPGMEKYLLGTVLWFLFPLLKYRR